VPHRHRGSVNPDSGTGPSVAIAKAWRVWRARLGHGQGNAGFDFKPGHPQVVDNFTYLRSSYSYKFGFDWQHIYDERTAAHGSPRSRRHRRTRCEEQRECLQLRP
jgi:hypothetical protein